MELRSIVKDSLKYPFKNIKIFLFLGIIILLSNLYNILSSLSIKNPVSNLLIILTLVFILLSSGYKLKVLESTLNGLNNLPEINKWKTLLLDGLNVIIVQIVYSIPILIISVILSIIMVITAISSGTDLTVASNVFKTLFLVILVAGIYTFLIFPILLMALANMASNERNISAAFKFGDIKDKILKVGLGKFLTWYIIVGLLYLAILGIGTVLSFNTSTVPIKIVGLIINSLIIGPFALIFYSRSVGLIYLSANDNPSEG